MKTPFAALLLFAGAAGMLHAAATDHGRITGRVQNRETGQYLARARITIKGTSFVAFADQTGTYRFANVPAGAAIVTAFYTGLEPQQSALTIVAGQMTQHDFELAPAGAAVQLEKFVVRGAKDLQTIAINEQRFAPNIKQVAAPDQVVTDGNVGEFLKSLPGFSAEYEGGEVMGISLRGFDSNLVGVTLDGSPLAGAHPEGTHRSIQMANLSMNNVSRVEITHVPTPSMPADSMAGSVNLISKSAFERNTAQLDYSLFLSGNQHVLTAGKSRDLSDQKRHKILPGFTFDYTLPVNKRFGLVLSASRSEIYSESSSAWKDFRTVNTGQGASISTPALQSVGYYFVPGTTTRNGASLKADWRATPNTLVSLSVQGVDYDQHWSQGSWSANAGANGRPAIANGVPMTFGPDFTHGATGQGSFGLNGSARAQKNFTLGENLRARFDNGTWRVEGGLGHSRSSARRLDTELGYFFTQAITAIKPVRVNFNGVTTSGPTTIELFDNNNVPVNPGDIQNYKLTAAGSTPRNTESAVRAADISLRRQLDYFSNPVALQIGAAESIRAIDTRTRTETYTYNGLSGNGAEPPAPYLNGFANHSLHIANYPAFLDNIPWISSRKLYSAWRANPALFSETAAQLVTKERLRINSSRWGDETVRSAYLQAETTMLHSRLNLVTGVRWEQTTGRGQGTLTDPGAIFLRDANGAFAHNAQGQQIRLPEAGAPGSMEQLRLTNRERAYRNQRSYDGFFPSLNATYHVTDNFQVRFGWAKTYGRPNFGKLIPSLSVSQTNLSEQQYLDPSQVRGTISVNNTALKPWYAHNYDLSFEYYSDQGGVALLSLFTKNIRDFFGAIVRPATADDLETLGLDASYLGWRMSTQTNLDRARISGVSLNAKQSLRHLGPLGRYFVVFGNCTQLHLEGEREADFSSFIKNSANWGVSFTLKNFDLVATWNYRGQQKGSANDVFGPDAYDYTAASTLVDVNLEYRIRKGTTLFLQARNLFNQPTRTLTYGSQTPAYARQNGTSELGTRYTAGIKGTF